MIDACVCVCLNANSLWDFFLSLVGMGSSPPGIEDLRQKRSEVDKQLQKELEEKVRTVMRVMCASLCITRKCTHGNR